MSHPTDQSARARRSGIQSIEIGGDVLEAMVQLGAPATLSEISALAGVHSAKAHRYLTSLCEIGLTRQDDTNGRYGLGPLALRMGLSAIAQHDIIERAYEVLGALCNRLRVSGHLSVWSDVGPVVIRSAHGGPPVISPVAVGTVLPLERSATGSIYLSYMPPVTTADVIATQKGPNDAANTEIKKMRQETQKTGYALTSGRYVAGLCAIALPVRNHDQSLAGAVTLVSTDLSIFTKDSPATKAAVQAIQELERNWSTVAKPGQGDSEKDTS
ncbi:IclR family transcriptional regulator [Gammaproteobacteria bacterium]|nr:IclR family transcriptional regulator [Gammaproteobacteria bacterium]